MQVAFLVAALAVAGHPADAASPRMYAPQPMAATLWGCATYHDRVYFGNWARPGYNYRVDFDYPSHSGPSRTLGPIGSPLPMHVAMEHAAPLLLSPGQAPADTGPGGMIPGPAIPLDIGPDSSGPASTGPDPTGAVPTFSEPAIRSSLRVLPPRALPARTASRFAKGKPAQ